MAIKYSSSVLFVSDIKVATKFYKELLELEIELDHGECIGFKGGLSLWDANYAFKIMGKENTNRFTSSETNKFEIYFESDSIKETYEKFEKKGIRFEHKMKEQPWGQRVFRFYDLDDNIIEMGEPMTVVIKRFLDQEMTVEEVTTKTSMPQEIVELVKNGLIQKT